MSFRPTIAVFADGRIADIGYYKNWLEKALFLEALTIALIYSDCGSVEEYRERKFGTQKIFYSLSPEMIENTDEELDFLISCSELSVAVDLSAGCIYVSEKPLSAEELDALPSALDPAERHRWLNKNSCESFSGADRVHDVPSDKLNVLKEFAFVSFPGGVNEENGSYYGLLKDFRFPFRELDREYTLELLRGWDDAGSYLSRDTYTELMRLGGGGGKTPSSFRDQ